MSNPSFYENTAPDHGNAGISSPLLEGHAPNATVYHTTGPDAYTSPLMAPNGSGPALNPRSCVTCRRRKVRCDKQMPCSNCLRALIPCSFPAPGRAPRQTRQRDPNAPPKKPSQREAELVKRLRKLEGIVEELSGQIDFEATAKGPSSAGSPEAPNQTGGRRTSTNIQQGISRKSTDRVASGSAGPSPRETDSTSDMGSDAAHRREVQQQLGRLVLNDHQGSTRYVSHGFWSKLNEELDTLRNDCQKMTDEDSDESDEESPLSNPEVAGGSLQDHHAFVLGYKSADADLRSCHPLPSHIPFLWSVFKENVDPLLKIVHVPLTEPLIRDARKNLDALSPGKTCLVLAIYFSAIISMEPEEVQATFNASKDELSRKYRFALEQALAKADFLTTTEFVVLQALTIYLIVVRRVDQSRFCWSLTGTAIRIAHGMGIHRDGAQLNMTPFEVEMRRRLWWAIVMLDLRSAEELGTDLWITDSSFDTQLPLNINDTDFDLETKELPPPREGRSDSSVVLVRYEILVLSRRVFMELASKNPNLTSSEVDAMTSQLYEHVRKRYLIHATGENDPLWWMAALVARLIMSKMRLFMFNLPTLSRTSSGLPDKIRYQIYASCTDLIEIAQKLSTDQRCKQFKWLFLTYSNWHTLAFSLIESCRRPWTPMSERAWETASWFDNESMPLAKGSDQIAALLPMRSLFARARKHRESELSRLSSDLNEARRLDEEEQLCAPQINMSPLPGSEYRHDEIRNKWWTMIAPEGTSPLPSGDQIRASAPGVQALEEEPTPMPLTDPTRAPLSFQHPGASGPLDFPDEAMGIMDEIMTQPSFPLTALWPLHEMVTAKAKNELQYSLSPGSTNTSRVAGNNSLSQEALALQSQAAARADSHVPPYLWGGTYDYPAQNVTSANMAGGANPSNNADMDMMEGDFDWRDWGQTLHNLDMSGM